MCGYDISLVRPKLVRGTVSSYISRLWSEEAGQDIAEYALMLAVILVTVAGALGAFVVWFRSTFP